MEAGSRGKLATLIEELLRGAAGFELFQALQLAEATGGGVRLRPAAEISFPAADLRRCRLDSRGRLEFEINLLGLYGVDSPLPSYLLEAAAGEEETATPLRQFLDLFAHRLYQLLYQGWKKHRPASGRPDGLFEAYLDAFAGASDRPDAGSRCFAGLFGRRLRSADALAGMLGEHLGLAVTVHPFQPRWVGVEERTALGADRCPRLGEDTLLGDRVLDCSRQVGIEIGPIGFDNAQPFLPGQPQAAGLLRLVGRYLPPGIGFELDLLLRVEGEASPLGGEIRLGWTPLLAGSTGRVTTVRLTDPTLVSTS